MGGRAGLTHPTKLEALNRAPRVLLQSAAMVEERRTGISSPSENETKPDLGVIHPQACSDRLCLRESDSGEKAPYGGLSALGTAPLALPSRRTGQDRSPELRSLPSSNSARFAIEASSHLSLHRGDCE